MHPCGVLRVYNHFTLGFPVQNGRLEQNPDDGMVKQHRENCRRLTMQVISVVIWLGSMRFC